MKKNKKILLISAPTGAGHTRAAEAIKKTIAYSYKNITVEHVDMMNFVNTAIKKTILDSYSIMAKQLPELWGLVYKKTDFLTISGYVKKIGNLFNSVNSEKLIEYIHKYEPDHILCTHFMPAQILSSVKKKHNLTVPISTLMTDYHSHNMQISPNIKNYFVSTEKMKWSLTSAKIPKNNITVSGIPIDPVFYENKGIKNLKSKYKTQAGKKNILILSGGQGLVDIHKILQSLFQSKKNLAIVAVAGTNHSLKQKLDKLSPPSNITLQTIGWTDKIDEYMRICDYIITKPGGLTTTECVMLNKPIIAISPIPGQEEYNAEYILENGLGVIARSPEDLMYYIENNFEKHLKPKNSTKVAKLKAADIIIQKICE